MEMLIRLAYPHADPTMLKLLGIDHFIDTLHKEEMRLKVRQSHPKTLRETVQTALELESFHLASRQRPRSVRGVKIDHSSESGSSTRRSRHSEANAGLPERRLSASTGTMYYSW